MFLVTFSWSSYNVQLGHLFLVKSTGSSKSKTSPVYVTLPNGWTTSSNFLFFGFVLFEQPKTQHDGIFNLYSLNLVFWSLVLCVFLNMMFEIFWELKQDYKMSNYILFSFLRVLLNFLFPKKFLLTSIDHK